MPSKQRTKEPDLQPFTVAIDGPAASGKGTVSRAIAAKFNLAYLDTGLLYRAVAKKVLAGEAPLDAARSLNSNDLEAPGLRDPDTALAASRVAADHEVRAALLDFQRAFARRSGGAVLDGRDIGTVICPQAEVKLYITASEAVRAQRRLAELRANGHPDMSFERVLEDLRARDRRDTARASAPLKPAEDAIFLDTSELSIEKAIFQASSIIAAKQRIQALILE